MANGKQPNDAGGIAGKQPEQHKNNKTIGLRALDKATEEMIRYAEEKNIKTVFSNIKKGCQLGLSGVCCKQCSMGPCKDKGKCGADNNTIVARNWLMEVARGTACHASHALHVATILLKVALSETTVYKIKNTEKLKAIAAKLKIDTAQGIENMAAQIATLAINDIVGDKTTMSFLSFLPSNVIENLFKAGVIPNSVAKDSLVVGHMTSMGVMADYESLMMWAARMGVADVVSMIICTELQDILLGIPKLICSEIGFGVLDERKVNIVVHGHDPLLVEKIIEILQEKRYINKARALGASGINIVGCCCTGNELLMRHGIRLVGSNLQQELVIATGLIEAFVVDVQCIFPNIIEVSKCFHTVVITTSEEAKIRGAIHIPFSVEDADKAARKIINLSINNFKKRNKEIIYIPKEEPKKIIAGFSVEICLEMFSKINPRDPMEPLISAVKKGDIYGIVLLAGCTSPSVVADANHVAIVGELIKKTF